MTVYFVDFMRFIVLTLIAAGLFLANLFFGSVSLPADEVMRILLGEPADNEAAAFIILESRLPQAATATLAGAALTVAGLMLQTAFRNPLAGAFLGSAAIMGILLLLSMVLKNDLMLLIAGIMVGYLASSVITLLNYLSTAEGVHSYTMWGMGNFNGVGISQLPVFSISIAVGLLLSVLLVKPLNVVLLGENYARNLGISMLAVRNLLLLSTGILTSIVTAYCGPISFIGLAVPHIAKMVFRTADHRIIIPGCMLTGAVVGLLCNLISVITESIVLPLNGVTPLIGVPVILYVILKKKA